MTTQTTHHYFVQTETRAYNSIDSLEHLIQVRRNWQDYTPTTEVFEWFNDGRGWVRINPFEMAES